MCVKERESARAREREGEREREEGGREDEKTHNYRWLASLRYNQRSLVGIFRDPP